MWHDDRCDAARQAVLLGILRCQKASEQEDEALLNDTIVHPAFFNAIVELHASAPSLISNVLNGSVLY